MGRIIKTYLTAERATYGDFWIRNEARKPFVEHAHRHEFFQIQFNLDGRTRHYVGTAERWLEPGCLAFVLPYRVHLGGHPGESRFFVINFKQSFLFPDLATDPLELESLTIAQAPLLAPFLCQDALEFRLQGKDLAMAEDACVKMMHEHHLRTLFSPDIIRAQLMLLISTICDRYAEKLAHTDGHRKRPHAKVLSRVIRYIRENLAGKISLAGAAEAATLSPDYLTNLLKQETGSTFSSLVTSRRMEKARELLTHTTLRISEIATATGFEDVAYFTRRFRQYFGVSPAAYRQSRSTCCDATTVFSN